jgi:hypothetical protein
MTQIIVAMGRAIHGVGGHSARIISVTKMDGSEVGNSWNIEHLRKFYP